MNDDGAPAQVPAGDQATVTVSLAVTPDQALVYFTRDIDRWWRRGPRFRNAPGERGFIHIEPGVGGRVFESFDAAGGTAVVEIGRIRIWEPATRLLFEWRNANFAPDEKTEVEVRFAPATVSSAASGQGCRVTVIHRGWSTLRQDHPARHRKEAEALVRQIGLWWGDQMSSLRALCAE